MPPTQNIIKQHIDHRLIEHGVYHWRDDVVPRRGRTDPGGFSPGPGISSRKQRHQQPQRAAGDDDSPACCYVGVIARGRSVPAGPWELQDQLP